MDEHIINCCPFSYIECPFGIIGCKEKIMRKNINCFMNSNNNIHLNLLLNDYLQFKEKIINYLLLKKEDFNFSNLNNNNGNTFQKNYGF